VAGDNGRDIKGLIERVLALSVDFLMKRQQQIREDAAAWKIFITDGGLF